MKWNYVEMGRGEPLVLLHGIGMSHRAWLPVLKILSGQRRVIAFDTAGFGESPILPEDVSPTTVNICLELQKQLKLIGIHEPVDIAGNSMGGWMALEAARLGFARTVVAISPAGLWHKPPARARHVFFNLRAISRTFPTAVESLLKWAWAREVLMAVPMTTGCRRMPAQEAVAAVHDFANATGFVQTFEQATRFEGGQNLTTPIVIAFGTHDLLLPRAARLRSELPAHAQWLQPKGWGHVPMWKDPEGVARLILNNTGAGAVTSWTVAPQ